jgi:hypothetical protein
MIDPATGWFENVEDTNKSAASIQDLFHNTWLAHYLQAQFIVFDNGGNFKHEFKKMRDNGANSNVSSNKFECKKIMARKPNQLQVTAIHPQVNAIIERVHKVAVVNDMLRSFDLENNHENIEEQEDYPFDYFLQSTALLSGYQKHLSHSTAGNTMSTCVWQRYDPQY